MFKSFENSWNLAKESWRVLMLDKEMLLFPIFSFVSMCIVYGAVGFTAFALYQAGAIEMPGLENSNEFIWYVMTPMSIFLMFVSHVIYTFFNAGLVTCAFIRLSGEDPFVSDGISIAAKRLPKLFIWSVIATTIGIILRAIKGRNNIIRSIFSGLLSFAWRVATYFVIPSIVAEDKSPIEAIEHSSGLIRKTWGEAAILNIGFGILLIPALLLPFLLINFAAIFLSVQSVVVIAMLVGFAIVYFLTICLLITTLDTIAKTALYMYATQNKLPEQFDSHVLESVFKRMNAETPALA